MEIIQTITNTLSDTKDAVLNALSGIRENICDFFDEETTVTRKTIAIICIVSALAGIIYGFLISPIKRGIQINVTNNNGNSDEDDDWE